jgi:hypothetical protein
MTHNDKGRLLTDSIPPLEVREPQMTASSIEAAEDAPENAAVPARDGLEWYREDPFANEHHEHWHIVYPTSGIPDGSGGRKFKDRQGELFFYMHRQMLARYDAERVSTGLPRVVAFTNYKGVVAEGYDPGPVLSQNYSPRKPNAKFSDIDLPDEGFSYKVADHDQFRKAIAKEMSKGGIFNHTDLQTLNKLGLTMEATKASESKDLYGNLHGMGHILAAYIPVMDKSGEFPGVMASTGTAIRDPFFYRWHKHIDDFYFSWQDYQNPNDFSDRPFVKIRKTYSEPAQQFNSIDVYLAFQKTANPDNNPDFDYAAYGNNLLNNANWDLDKNNDPGFTNALRTSFAERDALAADGGSQKITQLVHDEFLYYIRVENQLHKHTSLTIRIFLCPVELTTDRRAWIEMDKFVYELEPREKAVIYRKGSSSNVVKKPSVMQPLPLAPPEKPQPPFLEDGSVNPAYDENQNYCTCGWPYNLLLPRGTAEGKRYRLMVMATDWDLDRVGPGGKCGAMSYCGATDEYPDKRPMGYPFDKPFKLSIKDFIATNQNIGCKDLTIQFNEQPTA